MNNYGRDHTIFSEKDADAIRATNKRIRSEKDMAYRKSQIQLSKRRGVIRARINNNSFEGL